MLFFLRHHGLPTRSRFGAASRVASRQATHRQLEWHLQPQSYQTIASCFAARCHHDHSAAAASQPATTSAARCNTLSWSPWQALNPRGSITSCAFNGAPRRQYANGRKSADTSRLSQPLSSNPKSFGCISLQDVGFCTHGYSRLRTRSFSSQQSGNVRKVSGKGFSVSRTSVKWDRRDIDFFVAGLDPDGAGVGEYSAMSAVEAVKQVHPDLVLLGLGYLDQEKICETFSKEQLLRSRQLEPVDAVLSRDNGQFIPVIQHLLISGTPYYFVGRDRLVEMGSLGSELLWRPLEFYSLLWKLLRSNKQKEPVTPSLKKVLSEDSSEFCLLKVHQYLLEWTDSKFSAPEPVHGFAETKFTEKWLVGRNKSECQLRMRAKQFEMARLPLPVNLKSKPHWRVLVVCDVALEERLAERLAGQLAELQQQSPRFDRLFDLENTSSSRFHLCLMIYLALPVATVCRLLWKLAKNAYFEYWVKGSTVSVSGDEVLSRLRGEEKTNTDEEDRRRENFQVVESRWLGLKHSVRDKSRD